MSNSLLSIKNLKSFLLFVFFFISLSLCFSSKTSASTFNKDKSNTVYLNLKKHTISLKVLKMNNKLDNRIKPLAISNKISSKQTNYTKNKIDYTKQFSRSSNIKQSHRKKVIKPTNNSNLDLLARLVTAEAQGQPYKAQVAVAAVVLNRMKSSKFPNSIKAVIYDKSDGHYQFTPTANGFINKKCTSTGLKAAKEALKGSDPSNGALYYFDDSAKNNWLCSKPKSTKIGNMVFAY